MRTGAHPAVDFGGHFGDPVLAAADGTVIYARTSRDCGSGIRIWPKPFDRFTLYYQLQEIRVAVCDHVTRGQVIGLLGATGEPTWRAPSPDRAIPQLHFELASDARRRGDGDLVGTFDPLSITAGCFDPVRHYPDDHLVLTYPVRCSDPRVIESRGSWAR